MELPPSDLGGLDRVQIRILTLADHAAAHPDGKLYISGAGVHQLWLNTIPGNFPPLFLVLRVYVPYRQTIEPLRVVVRIWDEENTPIGPDPVLDLPNVEIGRAPGTRPGDENSANVLVGLTGFPVQAVGRCHVRVEIDGDVVGRLPLAIHHFPGASAGMPG